MSGETVWQGLAAILPIFHWTVLRFRAARQDIAERIDLLHSEVDQAAAISQSLHGYSVAFLGGSVQLLRARTTPP